MATWEYHTEAIPIDQRFFTQGGKVDPRQLNDILCRLGAQGWELVSAFDTNQTNGVTRDVVFIFKRQT